MPFRLLPYTQEIVGSFQEPMFLRLRVCATQPRREVRLTMSEKLMNYMAGVWCRVFGDRMA